MDLFIAATLSHQLAMLALGVRPAGGGQAELNSVDQKPIDASPAVQDARVRRKRRLKRSGKSLRDLRAKP